MNSNAHTPINLHRGWGVWGGWGGGRGLVCAFVLLCLCVFELEARKQTNLLGVLFRKFTEYSLPVSL